MKNIYFEHDFLGDREITIDRYFGIQTLQKKLWGADLIP